MLSSMDLSLSCSAALASDEAKKAFRSASSLWRCSSISFTFKVAGFMPLFFSQLFAPSKSRSW